MWVIRILLDLYFFYDEIGNGDLDRAILYSFLSSRLSTYVLRNCYILLFNSCRLNIMTFFLGGSSGFRLIRVAKTAAALVMLLL